MADARFRYPGRRSPTLANPARASMPVGLGHNGYSGDIHAIPTARYDASVPRRGTTEHRSPAAPTTTITTYNVTKDPVARSSSVREPGPHHRGRRPSSAADATPRPIIVTTNHGKPPASSHTSSGTAARPSSPPRDSYRANDESYYTQPASSIRARSQNRQHYGHGHSQSATLDNDEFYRLRERVGGDERLRAPDPFRHARPQSLYTNTPRSAGAAITGYEDEGFEYTGPSDLARYDLEHSRAHDRRESTDSKPYYRPSVNIVSNEPRYESRSRGPPPTAVGLDRYNQRAAAAGTYDRPSVAMPAPPPIPPSLVEPARRPALIESGPSSHVPSSHVPSSHGTPSHRSPSEEPRMPRPRPVSLYHDPAPRMSHPDDIYRPRDDERMQRRDRTDTFRDPGISSRGFGIRTDLPEASDRRSVEPSDVRRPVESPSDVRRSVEPPSDVRRSVEPPSDIRRPVEPPDVRRPVEPDRRDHDDRRPRREREDRESRRYSDEEIDRNRGRESRKLVEDPHASRTRVEDSRDTRDSKEPLRGGVRDKVATGLSVAAAAMGFGNPVKEPDEDRGRADSPRRRLDSEAGKEPPSSRTTDKYKPRDSSVHERRPSPQQEIVIPERRESKKDRVDSREDSRERERERGRDRDERDYDRERERDRDKEREYERERERDRDRRNAESKLTGSSQRDESPQSDGTGTTSRRRRPNSTAFDPTDTRDLMDLKSQLAAIDQSKDHESERTQTADTEMSSGSERRSARSRAQSRGREITSPSEDKQVRVVSPPRDKKPEKPIKGILKQPSARFPEDENPVREGVAPHKDDKTKKDVPNGARWTKINRRMVNPEALTIGKERYEVRDDFVIVLRVLSKEEIQAYATATAQIREMRRREYEKETGYDYDYDRERDDDERRRRHDRDRDRDRDTDSDRDRERHRRRREMFDEEEPRPKAIEYNGHGDDRQHSRRRSNRDDY